MRNCALLTFTLLWFQAAFCQTNAFRHPSTLGIRFVLQDFTNSSLFQRFTNQDKGIALEFVKGFGKQFDLQLDVSGSFPDSTYKNYTGSEKFFLLQSTVQLRSRFLNPLKSIQPFFLSGFGITQQQDRLGMMFAFGPAIEINYKNVYVSIRTQYHLALNDAVNSHYSSGVGIAGLLNRAKVKQRNIQQPVLVAPQKKAAIDRDGDGISDSLDACPDIPGLVQFTGCPDTDGDGIADPNDQCPKLYGFARYNGCPIPDRDNDGIHDEDDQCPDIPGISRYRGCPVPDADKDGVNDEEDSCRFVPGVRENNGCPLSSKEIIEQVNLAAKSIFFQTSSHKLLPNSFPALDQIIQILNNDKNLRLRVEGHTDNVGDQTYNLLLSEKRAKAVVDFLTRHGIDEKRLSWSGYGMQRPITSNETEKGRSTNRRVEIRVYY